VTLPLAAIGRQDIADFLGTLLVVYVILIFIRIVISWVPRMPYNRYLNVFLQFVTDVTDPLLNLFRRILPPVRLGPAALDLSPMIATIVVLFVGGIVVRLVAGN